MCRPSFIAYLCAVAAVFFDQPAQASPTYSFQIIDAPFQTASSALPGTFLNGINDLGQIVGYYQEGHPDAGVSAPPPGLSYQAFQRNADGTFTKITVPNSLNGAVATGINNAGLVSGYYTDNSNNTHGFLLNAGTLGNLDVPGPGPNGPATNTIALGINAQGDVVGSYVSGALTTSSPSTDAFLLNRGIYSDVSVPGVSSTSVLPFLGQIGFSRASGINSGGDIVGYYFARINPVSNGFHGFLLKNGSYSTFDFSSNLLQATFAYGINDLGQIVGDFTDSNGPHAYLYAGGIFAALDVEGATRSQALGINNLGQIVGNFVDSNGNTRGFIASPVSLPRTLCLFGSSLGILIRLRRVHRCRRSDCGRSAARYSGGGDRQSRQQQFSPRRQVCGGSGAEPRPR